MTTTGWIVAILSFAVALVLGFAACTLIRRRKEKNDQRKIEGAEREGRRSGSGGMGRAGRMERDGVGGERSTP